MPWSSARSALRRSTHGGTKPPGGYLHTNYPLAKHEAPSGTLEGDATVPSSQRPPSKQTSRQGREPPAAPVQKSLVGRNRGSFSPGTPVAPANELALEPQRTLQPNHPAHKAPSLATAAAQTDIERPVILPGIRTKTSFACCFAAEESGPNWRLFAITSAGWASMSRPDSPSEF
ncbi:hypothetical protein CSOJ01_06919 [Colletotrichum sojae]|uniref:Uncharacterized protein n=1 Tax=Colletotrichum sojae TaxID=2175907 RepID=A0A8H6JB48_9PEZI|nr:hypothetical protein CSOJ01_06919 [Colletotrichum sojae]